MAKSKSPRTGDRVAIVAGLRTPFVKAQGVLQPLQATPLACMLVAELVARLPFASREIDRLIFGQVVSNPNAPNIAREIILGAGLPRAIDAYSVSRACATGTQSLVDGAMGILSGDIDTAIVGGVDCLSWPPVLFSENAVRVLMAANAAKDGASKAKAIFRLRPRDLMPNPPAIAEASTGMTMGQSCELMAKQNGITRAAQDQFALTSHMRAAAAQKEGIFAPELMSVAVPPKFETVIREDNLVRADTTLAKLNGLRPVFDREFGTITAGNSSPLTDGASAVVLMRESKAKALGLEPLAFVRAWSFAAVEPTWQLLMGPAVAVPRVLKKVEMQLKDFDLVDIHEAFAAQVLSNLQAMASASFQKEHCGGGPTPGEIDPARLNIHGGSISLGHPFAATGMRQALTMANALKRRGGGTALITQCAAGGLGAALVLERD